MSTAQTPRPRTPGSWSSCPDRCAASIGGARRWALLGAAGLCLTLLGAGCPAPPPGLGGGRQISSLVEDWRDEIIYQIVVDRFANGDRSNDYGVERSHLGRYQGGDWQGIIDRIPYLEALGITAVWISPVVRNVEQDAGFAAYHGYWTQDFLAPNPHFGDLAALQRMVDALHAAGIKVILDLVVNHIGPLFYYDVNQNGRPDEMLIGSGGPSPGSQNPDLPATLTRTSEWDPDYDSRGVRAFTALGEGGPAPLVWAYQPQDNRVPVQPAAFQNPDWYHRRGRVTVWGDPPELGQKPCVAPPDNNVELCDYVREQEVLGDFPGGLKDLATERPEVQQALIEVASHWLAVGDFDGLRLDTLKHLDHGFLEAFCPAVRQRAKALGKERLLIMGEAFSGADLLLASYTVRQQVDAVLYFSQKFQVVDRVFKQGAPTAAIARLHARRQALFGAEAHPDGAGVAPRELPVNFLDNHDVERFLYRGTLEQLHLALTYLLTTVGVPCLYYGTEQQLAGATDPANREVLWRGNPARGLAPYDTENATFQHIAALARLRRELPALRRGDFEVRWSSEQASGSDDAGLFAYERRYQGQGVLVLLNARSCASGGAYSWTRREGELLATGFAPGSELVNLLADEDPQDSAQVDAEGRLELRVPCLGAKIFVLSDES